jgi:hypothetical protein
LEPFPVRDRPFDPPPDPAAPVVDPADALAPPLPLEPGLEPLVPGLDPFDPDLVPFDPDFVPFDPDLAPPAATSRALVVVDLVVGLAAASPPPAAFPLVEAGGLARGISRSVRSAFAPDGPLVGTAFPAAPVCGGPGTIPFRNRISWVAMRMLLEIMK